MTTRVFKLQRDIDESGVSGTGVVAEGVCFSDGSAAMRWLTDTSSTAIYGSMQDLEKIHGHGGNTRIVWINNGIDCGVGPIHTEPKNYRHDDHYKDE